MDISSCFELGYIIKAHGLKGEMLAMIDADFPEEYYHLESIFLKTSEGLIPFFIEYIEPTNTIEKIIIKLEDINQKIEAEKLKSSVIYLPLTDLPKLNKNQFYYHEIIGFKVIDEEFGEIGHVNNVYEMPIDDVLSISHKHNEVLVPLSDSIYKSIDKKSKTIYVCCPSGLIDVYLTKSEPDDED